MRARTQSKLAHDDMEVLPALSGNHTPAALVAADDNPGKFTDFADEAVNRLEQDLLLWERHPRTCELW